MKKLALLSILALSACGTIFSGTDQEFSFDSNVKGTEIYIDGLEICKTPCVYPLERKSNSSVVMAKKEGYETKQIVLRSTINKISILNLSSIPSWLTDVVTGGMWQYNRDAVYIDMEKTHMTKAEAKIKEKETAVRRFTLFNYNDLKLEAAKGEAGEAIRSLAALSGESEDKLISDVKNTYGEVNLAHKLTSVE